MSEDATLDEGAPGKDAQPEGQEPEITTQTQEGAPGDGAAAEEVAQERPKSKREAAMEAVEANRLRELEAESGLHVEGAAAPDAPVPGDQETGATEIAAEGNRQARRVKVDGEVVEVTDHEIRAYQKGVTADRRLEQAARERKEIEAENARLIEEREAFERMRAGGGESQATPIGDDDVAAAKSIYERIVSGDEEEAVAAIAELRKGRPEAIPSEEKVAARVRQQIDWEDAQATFARDYSDITADGLLSQIASNTLRETLKTATSYGQAFQEAGDRTRAWVQRLSAGSAQDGGAGAPDPGRADKQLRKERIDQPTAINARAAGKPQQEVPEPTAIIKEMRAARGLPT